MFTEDVLLGNVAIAAVLIKTIISFFRQYMPISQSIIPVVALVLGVLSAFIVGARVFDIDPSYTWALYAETVLAGILIGATAMGVHETTKIVKKGA